MKIWNDLHDSVKLQPSISTFKSAMKDHLLSLTIDSKNFIDFIGFRHKFSFLLDLIISYPSVNSYIIAFSEEYLLKIITITIVYQMEC